MLCLNISNITIITVKNVDYCCIIHNITKSEAIDLLESVVLEKCECIYINIVLIFCLVFLFFYFFFVLFSIYKMVDSMDFYKSLNISIGTIMKNLEMLKFVPDHLKTKKNV